MPDRYRHAASIVLLRPTGVCSPDECRAVCEVLLLHKPRKKDAWQLPQGGVEAGETVEEAALRELNEEAGIESVRLLGRSTRVYQYDFPPSYRRFRPDDVCGQHIEYVFALAPLDLRITVDGREIDASVWAMPERIRFYVKRKEYLLLLGRLVEEGSALVERR